MPYHVGAKGSSGCAGYPAIKTSTGEVMGCHKTRAEAAAQIYAINRSEGKIGKSMPKEGDMVMAPNEDEVYVGRVIHVMTDGILGFPGSEYSIQATSAEPAMLVQLFEIEEGGLDETEYFVGVKASDVVMMPSLEENIGMNKAYEGCGCPTCKELNVNCDNCPVCQGDMNKAYQGCGCEACKAQDISCADCTKCQGDMNKAYSGCGCETCKSQDISCTDCTKCQGDMTKKDPNYGTMIKPRSGGSKPANGKLYTRILQEAKDKFDVYPSAVANAWVVQEYKRRGGTYKAEGIVTEKRDFSGKTRERMASEGTAMPDGSFPIANRNDLMNAIQSVGRAKDYNAAKQHIMRRARALGLTDMLPEDWKKGVRKTSWGGSIFDLNPFVK